MRHFVVDGVNLAEQMAGIGDIVDFCSLSNCCVSEKWPCDTWEKTRKLIDLITVASLLDAGAGNDWKFIDSEGNIRVSFFMGKIPSP